MAELKGMVMDSEYDEGTWYRKPLIIRAGVNELTLIEFFNAIVYIKEKDKHDALIIKNARNPK